MNRLTASWYRKLIRNVLVGSALVVALQASGGEESNCNIARLNTDDLRPWEPKEVMIDGKPVLVVLGSNDDTRNLETLSPHVFEPGGAAPLILSDGRVVFAVIPVSPYSSCRVNYIPRGTNDMRWDEMSWLGGFHSPCHSEVFDLLGRQIKPGPYSPTGFPKFIGNLPSPELRVVSDSSLEIVVK